MTWFYEVTIKLRYPCRTDVLSLNDPGSLNKFVRNLKQEQRKVSSKGQVTIPKSIRVALKIKSGSEVTFWLEGDKIVIRPFFDALAVFRRIAKETNYNGEIDSHAYEEELEERYQRALSGANEQAKGSANNVE